MFFAWGLAVAVYQKMVVENFFWKKKTLFGKKVVSLQLEK